MKSWLSQLIMKFKQTLPSLVALLVVLGLLYPVVQYWGWLSEKYAVNSNIIRNIVLTISPILALLIALWRIRIADKQTEISEKNNLDSFFQKGVEMVGSQSVGLRIGGIYSLTLLSEKHPDKYHLISMKIICSFLNSLGGAIRQGEYDSRNSKYDCPFLIKELISFVKSRGEIQCRIEKEYGHIVKLRDTDLHNVDLKGVNLGGASLTGVDFRFSDLSDSDLCKVNADLEDFDLLQHYTLDRAKSTKFENACFKESKLTGASLRGAVLDGADFSNAILEGAKMTNASIEEVNFSKSNLKKANLDNVIGEIDESIMPQIGEEWHTSPFLRPRRVNFKEAVLIEASLRDSRLVGANFRNANLESANISHANFKGAIFCGSNLKKVEGIDTAILTDAIYDKRTKFPEAFCPKKKGMKEECPKPAKIPW